MENVGLLQSFYRVCRYHLGTLAFGSLILSFIRMVRVALEWIEDKIKEHGAENPLIKAVMCCCKCCLWCLEKFMRFINRNAYIMCAVKVSAILEILFYPTYFFFAEHKLLFICQGRL